MCLFVREVLEVACVKRFAWRPRGRSAARKQEKQLEIGERFIRGYVHLFNPFVATPCDSGHRTLPLVQPHRPRLGPAMNSVLRGIESEHQKRPGLRIDNSASAQFCVEDDHIRVAWLDGTGKTVAL